MPDFKTITLRPMTGAFDTLSSADEIGFGNWRLVKNATTRSTRNRQRAGGWRRLFADDDPYNNQDLHDQLVDRLGFYDSYVGHSAGGGGQSGYGYPYFAPSYQIPGFSVFPAAEGPYCPVYIGDFPSGSYNGCPIFYPSVGYPYALIPGIINSTGARAHWKMDTIAGTTPDLFGGLDLTNFGPTVTDGLIDDALLFSGGTWLNSADAAFQTGDITFGFTGWFYRPAAGAGTQVIVGKWGTAGNRNYRLVLVSDQLRLDISSNGTLITSVTHVATIPLEDWTFFAIWHDPVANTINLKVNDSTTDSTAHSTGVSVAGIGSFMIGFDEEFSTSALQAKVDSVTFWKNRFPSESELLGIYNFALGIDYPFSSNACDTGYPFYYVHSFLYTSCPVSYPPVDVAGYPYGYAFNVYDPSFSYDYVYCYGDLHLRQGCREAITMLNEIVTSDGRKLIAATMSRVYELNQSAGNWRILVDGLGNAGYTAEQCTCNSIRGVSSTMGSYLLFTNNIDPPMIYLLGTESAGCALNAMEPISDLVALGITRAGGVIVWRGFAIWYDLNENGNRFSGDVMWSDLEDPNSYIESDTSFAGRATIAVGETILAAAPLGNWLILYTDKSIIRVTLVGGEDVFNFERIYTGGNALKYKFSLVNGGDFHLYLGESDIYVFTQFDTRPITVNWITRAAGFIFNGIVEDDATYEPLNKEMCHLVTGGWSEEKHEAFLSWPTGDNICPNVTLRLNMKFNAADLVDHGFTSFLTFRKDDRPTVGEWLEDMGICARGTKVAVSFKDGHVCSGDQDAVVDPPLYLRNPTEDPDLPVHPDSLCAALGTRTLDDFCEDCAVLATFIAASAEDFTLKQLEDDIYYRERLAAGALPCQDFNFSTESGEGEGFTGTSIVLDQWLPIGGVNCTGITSVSLITKAINYDNCGAAGTLAFSSAAETGERISDDSRWGGIEYIDSIDRVAADSDNDTGIALYDFTGVSPVLDYVLPIAGTFRMMGQFYHPGEDRLLVFIRYNNAPSYSYRLAFFDPVTGFIDELDLGLTGGSNLYTARFCPIDDTRVGVLCTASTFTRPHLLVIINVVTRSVSVSQFYEGNGGTPPTRDFGGLCYSCELDLIVTTSRLFAGGTLGYYINTINPTTLAIVSSFFLNGPGGPINGPFDLVYMNSTGLVFGWEIDGYYEIDPVAGTATLMDAISPGTNVVPRYHWKIDRVVARDSTNNILLYKPSDFSKIVIPLTSASASYNYAVQRNGGKFYVHDEDGSVGNIHEINVT